MLCRIGAAKNSTEHIEVLTLNTLCSEGSQNLSFAARVSGSGMGVVWTL